MTDERHHHRAVAAAICKPPSDWKRPPGRPNHAWLRAIESDLRPLNIGPSYMRGRSQPLENAGVRLWTRLRSRRACGRQEMSVYTCVCRVSVRDASISPELYVHGRGSVFLCWRCDTLCTSRSMNGVMLHKTRLILKVIEQGSARI